MTTKLRKTVLAGTALFIGLSGAACTSKDTTRFIQSGDARAEVDSTLNIQPSKENIIKVARKGAWDEASRVTIDKALVNLDTDPAEAARELDMISSIAWNRYLGGYSGYLAAARFEAYAISEIHDLGVNSRTYNDLSQSAKTNGLDKLSEQYRKTAADLKEKEELQGIGLRK
jgi:hypothetical protein